MTAALRPLATFCAKNDLPWSPTIEESFASYLDLLVHFNQVMNLIGPLDEPAIIDQLLIDSAAAAAVCAPGGPILDVGTGAGLPGIPLKLLYPDLPITLVEPRRKRTTFLKIVTTRLELSDVSVERKRIEELDEARFDYVISKAFQPPLDWVETASAWVSGEGVVVCMTRPEVRAELDARAAELGLEPAGACDDVRELGAPDVGETRAVYGYGAR